jgi:hypothetical protein
MLRVTMFSAVVVLFGSAVYAAEEYRAIFWNLESGDSSAAHIAAQAVAKGPVDFWGFSEVQGQSVVNTIEAALEAANPGGHPVPVGSVDVRRLLGNCRR